MKTSIFILLFALLSVTRIFAQPPCGGQPVATDNMTNVPLICDINGYCGNTSGAYTDWSWPALDAAFCGSIENNSFVSFIASSSTVEFDVWVSNSATGNGIQIMVFSTTGPGNPVTEYECDFQFQPSPVGQPFSASGLTPGNTYYIMIDGFAGDVSDYVLSATSGVQVSGISPDQANICLGNSITLNASGGNGTYVWEPSPYLNTLTGSQVIATPTEAGTFEFTVTADGVLFGCPSVSTTTITVVEQPNPNAGPDQTVCLGEPIDLVGIKGVQTNTALWSHVLPSGLTPPATAQYSPSFNNQTPTVTVNQPGIYRFIFREQNPICGIIRDTCVVTVIQASQTVTKVDPSCAGLGNGSITIVNPDAAEFSFDGGATWVSQNTTTNLLEGTYQVCSKTVQGCEVCSSIALIAPVSVQLSLSNDTLVCQNGTATLVATASNGTNFSYIWGHTTSTAQSQQVSPTENTYYSVYAESGIGCQSASDSIYVTVREPISGTISENIAFCPGYPLPLVSAATGGIGQPYSFVWSTGSNQIGVTSSTTPNLSQTTDVSVTISDGCESTSLTLVSNVVVYPLPQPTFEANNTEACEPAIFILTNTTSSNTMNSFYWNLPEGNYAADQMEVETVALDAGAYNVELVVTSVDGCVDSITYTNYLVSHPIPVADFSWNPNPVMMFNTQVQFNNQSEFATDYSWIFEGASPGGSSQENPLVKFPDGEVGNYTVQLIASSDQGCSDTAVRVVTVLPEVILYAPNTFTPDGDEFNQSWQVFMEGIDVSNFELKVFNRWGQLIFVSNDVSSYWDGTFNGQIVQSGVYTWTIKAKDAQNDAVYEYQGHVQILR